MLLAGLPVTSGRFPAPESCDAEAGSAASAAADDNDDVVAWPCMDLVSLRGLTSSGRAEGWGEEPNGEGGCSVVLGSADALAALVLELGEMTDPCKSFDNL